MGSGSEQDHKLIQVLRHGAAAQLKVTLIGTGDLMLHVDSQGYILDDRVKRTPRPLIEHGVLHRICGIIVAKRERSSLSGR